MDYNIFDQSRLPYNLDQSPDNLRVHEGNGQAWAALCDLAKSWPDYPRVPILLAGPKNSGKTHLMRAFEHHFCNIHPTAKISWQSPRNIADSHFRLSSRLRYVRPSNERSDIDVLFVHSTAIEEESLGLQDLFVQLMVQIQQTVKILIFEARCLPNEHALVAPHPDAIYLPSYKSLFKECSMFKII
jgi:chromosomal replication initiation ATPase DnaA